MIKFPFQGYKIFIKSFYYINFFNSFHKTLHFFFFLRRCFIIFFWFSLKFPLIKLFVYFLCLFSKNIVVCFGEDIGWSYLKSNFCENYSQYCYLPQKDSKSIFYFYLFFLLFLYALTKFWSNYRLMIKFSLKNVKRKISMKKN